MASLYAEIPFDMSSLSFAMLRGNKLNDLNSTYFSLYYDKSSRAFFGEHYISLQGEGLKYSNGVPSAGTVTGIWWYNFDGDAKPYKQYLQLHPVSLKVADIVAAAKTASLADDAALFERALGGKDDINGEDGKDVLFGFGGDDVIWGNAGNDKLYGGTGNDLLIGGEGADLLSGGSGSDAVSYAYAAKGLTINLADAKRNTGEAAGDTYVSIEKVRGSDHNDRITGNAVGNTINGGAGRDILTGGGGRDYFVFGEIVRGNVDTITDFNVRDDRIALSNFEYGFDFSRPSGTPGWFTIDAQAFWSSANGKAHDESDRILYNSKSGALTYDADGTGVDAPELIGVLGKGLALTHANVVFFY